MQLFEISCSEKCIELHRSRCISIIEPLKIYPAVVFCLWAFFCDYVGVRRIHNVRFSIVGWDYYVFIDTLKSSMWCFCVGIWKKFVFISLWMVNGFFFNKTIETIDVSILNSIFNFIELFCVERNIFTLQNFF